MEKYFINYHTGAGNEEVEVNDLNEAKKIAQEGISYTQKDISIETLDGETITTARWYGVQADEDNDNVLETIGRYGYYARWDDEFE